MCGEYEFSFVFFSSFFGSSLYRAHKDFHFHSLSMRILVVMYYFGKTLHAMPCMRSFFLLPAFGSIAVIRITLCFCSAFHVLNCLIFYIEECWIEYGIVHTMCVLFFNLRIYLFCLCILYLSLPPSSRLQ